MSAGFSHTVVVTIEGQVFSFGRGLQGQLGHGGEENEPEPRQIDALSGLNVVQVTTGARHTAVVSDVGEVWTFGFGGYGRLGHGGCENEMLPRKIEGTLVGRHVTEIVAGLDFTVAVCSLRRTVFNANVSSVFTFGLGQCGRLGHGTEEHELTPRLVEGLVGKSVTQVAAGFNHTVVATADGLAFSFGRGLQGQLGHGEEANELRPRLIECIPAVARVTAGARHTAVITRDGAVWSFGHGGYGRLGHGSNNRRELLPKRISGFENKVIKHISAGGSHTVALTQTGEVFTFGNGPSGQLGLGKEALMSSTPCKVPRLACWVDWGQRSGQIGRMNSNDSEVSPWNTEW